MSKTVIPRIFHFVYGLRRQTEPFHLAHYLCLETCRRINCPERILFHYHYEPWGRYWDLIRDKLERHRVERPAEPRAFRYADRHMEKYRYAHESDYVRLDALIQHGGVYADIDTLFVRPLPDALFHHPFVLGREGDIADPATGVARPSLCNAFILSAPGAAFARTWREELDAAFDGTWSNHSTLLPWRLAQANPNGIHVAEAVTFYPFMWTREDLRCLFEQDVPVPERAVSIHLWAHLWWAEQRRDFSDFHAGCITEAVIRRKDTTFNRLVRKYLPELDAHPSGLRRGLYRLKQSHARSAAFADRVARRLRREWDRHMP